MSLIGLIIAIVVLGFVFFLLNWLISQVPMPAPFAVAARVALAILIVLVLLGMVFGGVSLPRIDLR